MTDVINLGWIVIAIVAIVAMLRTSQQAEHAKTSAAEIERQAQTWQQRALEAEAKLDAAHSSYATLQALYCEWVRKTLGASVAIYRVEKEEK